MDYTLGVRNPVVFRIVRVGSDPAIANRGEMMDAGAHFHCCDFQVHTPRDAQWAGTHHCTDEDRTAFAGTFIQQCRQKGLDAVAITDHHDLTFFSFIKNAAKTEIDDAGRSVPENRQIIVFPGMELTLGVPCQALLLLDADFDERLLTQLYGALAITHADPSQPQLPSNVTRLDHITTLQQLYEELDRHDFLRGRYIVMPNVSDGGNGELANAILCVIEEKDVSKHPGALNKIREWVTCRSLPIRRMRVDTYEIPSTLHFMQCSNWFHALPNFPGDTRTTVIHVPRFTHDEIPKEKLLGELKKEAPHFLRTLLDLELPAPDGRLRLPFVETEDKAELADENAPLNRFLAEQCELKEGERTIKVTLFNAYNRWAFDNGFDAMNIIEFGKQLRAVTKNKVYAKGQKTDKDGKLKHCYEGVSLTMAV